MMRLSTREVQTDRWLLRYGVWKALLSRYLGETCSLLGSAFVLKSSRL